MATVEKEETKRKTKGQETFPENKDSEYLTLSFKGLTLPWAILLSVVIFTAGIGSALYFGLKARPAQVVSGLTPTPTVDISDPSAFAQVSLPFVQGPQEGNKDAKVVIVEFSDLVCPYCQKFHEESYKSIYNDYIKTGKVSFVYKHYPLSFHEPAASISAKAGYCVQSLYGDSKFYEYADKFFSNVNNVTQNGYDKQNNSIVSIKDKQFYALFGQIGVDSTKIKNCISTAAAAAQITADEKEFSNFSSDVVSKGLSEGLGTPSLVVGTVKDGVLSGRLIEGAYPYSSFRNVIEEQLNK